MRMPIVWWSLYVESIFDYIDKWKEKQTDMLKWTKPSNLINMNVRFNGSPNSKHYIYWVLDIVRQLSWKDDKGRLHFTQVDQT